MLITLDYSHIYIQLKDSTLVDAGRSAVEDFNLVDVDRAADVGSGGSRHCHHGEPDFQGVLSKLVARNGVVYPSRRVQVCVEFYGVFMLELAMRWGVNIGPSNATAGRSVGDKLLGIGLHGWPGSKHESIGRDEVMHDTPRFCWTPASIMPLCC